MQRSIHFAHRVTLAVLLTALFALPRGLPAEDTEAPPPVKKISLAEFEALQAKKEAVILDVRTPDEFQAGHVPGAININWRARDFNEQVEKLDKSQKYVVHCLAGPRSANACTRLGELGFSQIVDFSGGWRTYQAAGKPVATGAASTTAVAAPKAEVATPKHKLIRPDKAEWKDGPASLPPGAKIAVLEGDPSKEGFFALRLQLPDGYKIPAHWHPGIERLTIISGTFHLGMGDKLDPSKAEALPAGSYVSMQPQMKHFAWAEGPTVVQLATNGPWEIHYVNASDDPRQQKK